MPLAAMSAPAMITGLVPMRGSSGVAMPAEIMKPAVSGQVGEAGLDRRVAEDVLHVEAEEEEHRVEAGERDELGQVGGGEPLDPEDRERDERVAGACSLPTKAARMTAGGRELADRARRAPADLGRLDQRVDQQQHPGGDEDGAGEVEAARRRAPRSRGDERERAEADEDGDRHVDVEDPAPAGPLGEHAAEDDAGGAGEAGHGGPGAERVVAVARLVKVVVRIESAAGDIIAAPIPWASAGADEHAGVWAAPPTSEADREQDRARRPGCGGGRARSAARPPSSRKPP